MISKNSILSSHPNEHSRRSKIKSALTWLLLMAIPLMVMFLIGVVGAFYGFDALGDMTFVLKENREITFVMRLTICSGLWVFLPEILRNVKDCTVTDVHIRHMRWHVVILYLLVELVLIRAPQQFLSAVMGVG